MKMYEKTVLRVSHTEENTELLGPYRRFVIWVHGCCFDCEGCLAQNTRYGAYDEVPITALAERIVQSGCEGITVSGGEPFLQADALAALIGAVRMERDVGVIVYSGFTIEEIRSREDFLPLLVCADILIDGRYVRQLDDGRAYIGSSNQRLHYLTPRYREAGAAYYACPTRRAEIKLTADRAVLIGVPSENVLQVWQAIKKKSGGISDDF